MVVVRGRCVVPEAWDKVVRDGVVAVVRADGDVVRAAGVVAVVLVFVRDGVVVVVRSGAVAVEVLRVVVGVVFVVVVVVVEGAVVAADGDVVRAGIVFVRAAGVVVVVSLVVVSVVVVMEAGADTSGGVYRGGIDVSLVPVCACADGIIPLKVMAAANTPHTQYWNTFMISSLNVISDGPSEPTASCRRYINAIAEWRKSDRRRARLKPVTVM